MYNMTAFAESHQCNTARHLRLVQTSGKSTVKLKYRIRSECIITKKYFNKSVIIIKEQLMNSKIYTIKITCSNSIET